MQRQKSIPNKTLGIILAIGAMAPWSATTATAGVVPFFMGLGDLPGGGSGSFANAISADGSAAVGLGAPVSGNEAFRWTAAGGMVGIGDLSGGGFQSLASDISADGSVVVGHGTTGLGAEAFRWTLAGGMAGLGDIPGGLVRAFHVFPSRYPQ